MASLLRDSAYELPERPLIWHFQFYHPEKEFNQPPSSIGTHDFTTSQTRPHSAIRLDHHKLLHFDEGSRDELYDLLTDPRDTTDLAAAQPGLATQLRDRLQSELKASRSRFAVP